jgi:hypothetical protein
MQSGDIEPTLAPPARSRTTVAIVIADRSKKFSEHQN